MKPTTVWILGAIGFILCVAIGIYYLVPLPSEHLFSSHGPNYSDTKHAIAFFGLGVFCLIAARVVSATSRSNS